MAIGITNQMLDLKKPFKLVKWSIFPNRLVIKGSNGEKTLEPKVMEMLVYRAEHAGETVTREILAKEIWRGTFGSLEIKWGQNRLFN